MMIWIIIAALAIFIFGFIPWSIGVYTFWHWAQKPEDPNDGSNRINNIVSWHLGLTRSSWLGKFFKFGRQDVLDNIIDVEVARRLAEILKEEKSNVNRS